MLSQQAACDIVLVGGGHAHVAVLKRFGMRPQPGVRLTLIARDVETPYSGMLPGYLAGHYERRECHVDLAPLSRFAGARLYAAAATGIDLAGRRVLCAGRPPVPFDLLSLDVGSTPDLSAIPGAAEHALAVKPVDRFLAGWERAEAEALARRGRFRLVVVGGGAGGVELALSLRHRLATALARQGDDAAGLEVTVASADPVPLPRHAATVRRRMARAMRQRGVRFLGGHRAVAVEPGRLRTEPAADLPFDAAVMATHAAAAPWLAASGLAVDGRGFVAVDAALRSTSHRFVFAAGDCAAFQPRRLEKSGVFAVRQGPLLAASLARQAAGRPAKPYRPQRRTLALVSTGDACAVASYGPFALEGRWVWQAKDRIDRAWMRKYRELPEMAVSESAAPMRCGGCGAKVASAVLARVLARLDVAPRPDVLLGLADGDDAAALLPPQGQALVQTVDQFRPFLDDPWLFGRIAANHALGDLFAKGARPHSALALVTLPAGPEEKLEADLHALLAGALEVLNREDVTLLGGHTAEGAELAFGLSLNGWIAPERLMRKAGARPGDRLLLTRPLGTGTLFAAHMRGKAEAPWLAAALAGMQRSSREAAAILARHGARAATDVTGFGLAGHLVEMLRSGGIGATLDLSAVPALPGALALLERGIESTLAPANRAFAAAMTGGPEEARRALLFDPQTAGGLLAALPAATAGPCLAELKAAGETTAAEIGAIVAANGIGPRIAFAPLHAGRAGGD